MANTEDLERRIERLEIIIRDVAGAIRDTCQHERKPKYINDYWRCPECGSTDVDMNDL